MHKTSLAIGCLLFPLMLVADGVAASGAPFPYLAAGETVTQASSTDFAFKASGTGLTASQSGSFRYRAAGETLAQGVSAASTYRAVGEAVAFGTSRPFRYVAAGESIPSELLQSGLSQMQASTVQRPSTSAGEGHDEAYLKTTSMTVDAGKAVIAVLAYPGKGREAIDMTALRVNYYRSLGTEPVVLEPEITGVAEDGSLILEVAVPAGESGFLQPVVLQ